MQNMDFYSGKDSRVYNQSMGIQDADNVARLDAMYRKEADRNKKKASRMMSIIIGLCIISFTAGLVVGIKFASGAQTEIIDDNTRQAVTQIGSHVSNLISNGAVQEKNTAPKNVFPRDEYPFVIKLKKNYNVKDSREIAQFLSQKGHTVIVSNDKNRYKLYVGPFRDQGEAARTIQQISAYNQKEWFNKIQVVKR
jgi:hypothetical protein